MSRFHQCPSDTPLTTNYVKLPVSAVCREKPGCGWYRQATDSSVETMRDVRAAALHHAKTLGHHVVVHLCQDVHLEPQAAEAVAHG